MKDKKEFYSVLEGINGRKYRDYVELVGDFDFARYVLKVINIPEAGEPALLVVRVPQHTAAFPPHLFNSPVRRTALEDLLTRQVGREIERRATFNDAGIARRSLSIAAPGQKILPRTALVVTEEYVEARIYVDLPMRQDRVDSDSAFGIFFEDLTDVVNASLIYSNLDERDVETFVDVMEDVDQIRQMLSTRGFVGFVGQGSLLERAQASDLPSPHAHPVQIPEELLVEMEVPNRGTVRGLGIPTGLTVIMGDAYSGRIDLMRALADGIYNHIPGDGREFVVAVPDAVQVCAESGRSVQRVDISNFVRDPGAGIDTSRYSAAPADSCAAQAASTVEALEVGAQVLFYDAQTSSSAFLTRDSRLRGLMPAAESRVTPLSAVARGLVDELGISIVVAGQGSVTEFIPIADTVLRINNGEIVDITAVAKNAEIAVVADEGGRQSLAEIADRSRWVVPTSIDPSSGKEEFLLEVPGIHEMVFGRSRVDLGAVRQIADIFQTHTIGAILYYAKNRYLDEGRPLKEILDLIDRDLSSEGLEVLTRELSGKLVRPRRYEIAAVLNRLPTMRISHTTD